MSTLNDMTEPASAARSTSRGADGVAASRSTVDIELVCVKGERNSDRNRNSWASKEIMDGKGDGGRVHRHTGSVGRQKKMFLGKEIFLDAGTEWRVKWSQRGLGTFSVVALFCYIVGTSISHLFSAVEAKHHEEYIRSY